MEEGAVHQCGHASDGFLRSSMSDCNCFGMQVKRNRENDEKEGYFLADLKHY